MGYLFDTDPGIDDAIAITLALAAHEPVEGLCTVAGNVDEPVAAASAASLLAALDRVLPIHRGAVRPILRERTAVTRVHGEDGLGGALPRRAAPPPDVLAVERLLSFRDTLVAVGPLTNVATAVLCNRGWPRSVPKLVIMGGACGRGGNSTAAAEFNFYSDPEAAAVVLGAGFATVYLVPLEAGNDLRLGPSEMMRLERIGSPAADVVRRLLGSWHARIAAGGVPVYDATAWIAARYPEIFRWEDVFVRVDLGHDAAYGASLVDRRPAAPPPNVRLYAGCDHAAYWGLFFAALGERGAAGGTPAAGGPDDRFDGQPEVQGRIHQTPDSDGR